MLDKQNNAMLIQIFQMQDHYLYDPAGIRLDNT